MNKTTAAIFFALLALPCAVVARAPQKPKDADAAYRVLEAAQVAFDSGDYGNAIKYANQAKDARRAESEYETYILENAIAPRAVKRVGNAFTDVLSVLEERDEKEAVSIINLYLRRHGKDFFSDSVEQMVLWIKEKGVYPEADFMIARVYQLEGEYEVALQYYERARKEIDYLDIPAESFDILYAMADLAYQQRQYEAYEQMLLLILDGDASFKDKVFLSALLRTIDFDTEKHVDRFFLLFRCDPNHSLAALYALGNIYAQNGDDEQALQCAALGVIESLTHIIATLTDRDAGFQYTDFGTFLEAAGQYPDIVRWGSEQHVWDMFFQFAERVASRGKLIFARSLYKTMATSMPDAYWRAEAQNRLRSPAFEAVTP